MICNHEIPARFLCQLSYNNLILLGECCICLRSLGLDTARLCCQEQPRTAWESDHLFYPAGGNELLNLPTQAGYYLSLLSCNLSTLRWCMCRCILDLVNIALFFRQQRQCWQTLYAASTMQRRRTAKSCIDGWEVLNRKVCLSYHVSWCLKICNHVMAPVLYDSKKNTIVIYY